MQFTDTSSYLPFWIKLTVFPLSFPSVPPSPPSTKRSAVSSLNRAMEMKRKMETNGSYIPDHLFLRAPPRPFRKMRMLPQAQGTFFSRGRGIIAVTAPPCGSRMYLHYIAILHVKS